MSFSKKVKKTPPGEQRDRANRKAAWREWASQSLPSINLSIVPCPPEHKGRHETTWILEEDGATVGIWRDADVPWLFDWMDRRLGMLHGAWHVACDEMIAAKRLADLQPIATASRKKNADLKREQRMEGITALQREADRLRKAYPDMLIKDVRAELAKFLGANPRTVRGVKIARRRKKLPRP